VAIVPGVARANSTKYWPPPLAAAAGFAPAASASCANAGKIPATAKITSEIRPVSQRDCAQTSAFPASCPPHPRRKPARRRFARLPHVSTSRIVPNYSVCSVAIVRQAMWISGSAAYLHGCRVRSDDGVPYHAVDIGFFTRPRTREKFISTAAGSAFAERGRQLRSIVAKRCKQTASVSFSTRGSIRPHVWLSGHDKGEFLS